LKKVRKSKAEMSWMIYDLVQVSVEGQQRFKLTKIDEIFTEFEPALLSITTASPGSMSLFMKALQEKLDEKLETSPSNKLIESPL
jgi:hypothetical protein